MYKNFITYIPVCICVPIDLWNNESPITLRNKVTKTTHVKMSESNTDVM